MTEEILDDEAEDVVLPPIKVRIKIHGKGPALWPERFSAKKLRQIAKTLGSYAFSALYQGHPSPEGGGLFKRSWFRYYRLVGDMVRLDGRAFQLAHCRRFGTVDLAFSVKTEADWTVIAAWAVTPDADLVLLDLHRERMTGDRLVPSCREMMRKWDLDYIGIEDVQAQTLVVQTARKQGLTVRALKANMDKVTRAIVAQVRMEAGQVWFPQAHPELDNLEKELMTFPKGAKDDTVDVFAYAALEVQRFGAAPIPPEERARLDRERKELAWREMVEKNMAARADWDRAEWWDGSWSRENV